MSIYIWEDVPVVTTAGIYHSAEDGLISLSSDGTNRVTIADKNLGATNANDTGNYFQRGNNYGFPTTGSVSTGSQVNAGSYGPGNYYSSSIFRLSTVSPYTWDSSNNTNLRGGGSDTQSNNRGLDSISTTKSDRKGPCSEGYHIPCAGELDNLLVMWAGLKSYSLTTNANGLHHITTYTSSIGEDFDDSFLVSRSGARSNSDGNIGGSGVNESWWSSSPSVSVDASRRLAATSSDLFNDNNYGYRAVGNQIRPFKNEAVQPTEDWTVLYQPS